MAYHVWRSDIANDVIHFTKGDSPGEAFAVLSKIVKERRLCGGSGFIRGGYNCVCFTEAPLAHLASVFARTATERFRYMPFGILLPKAWLFERGGRPVIYQADDEYNEIPEALRYRHVRYEPHAQPPVDFTWEREWRILTDELRLDPEVAFLVLPSQEYLDELRRQHDMREENAFELYSLAVGAELAEQLREPFDWWKVYLLEPPELPQYKRTLAPRAV
jgi:hypothetical protein